MLSAGFGCAGDYEEHPRVCLQVPVQPQQSGNFRHILSFACFNGGLVD